MRACGQASPSLLDFPTNRVVSVLNTAKFARGCKWNQNLETSFCPGEDLTITHSNYYRLFLGNPNSQTVGQARSKSNMREKPEIRPWWVKGMPAIPNHSNPASLQARQLPKNYFLFWYTTGFLILGWSTKSLPLQYQ